MPGLKQDTGVSDHLFYLKETLTMDKIFAAGSIFAVFDLILCYFCLIVSRSWREALISLLAIPASVIGCLWLCWLVGHTGIGLIICDLLNLIVISSWIHRLELN
jgi:predicted exporter